MNKLEEDENLQKFQTAYILGNKMAVNQMITVQWRISADTM
jgi:hypothetical protein